MTQPNLENKTICMWKIVASNDEQKMKEGNTYVTFSVDKECFKCDGQYKECNNYLTKHFYTQVDKDYQK